MIDWIMVCVTTAKFSININGNREGYLKSGRGLKQGDPISPYLFTMVMEMFNLILKKKIRDCKEFRYHFGCKRMQITHLCFADDLIVLCNGDIKSVTVIKQALEDFSNVSGLKPHLNKSTVFFGGLNSEEQDKILQILPFSIRKLPVRYLGVPLITKQLSVNDCKPLIEKVKSRINNWKNKFLSYSGRLQLIASVLSSLHQFWATVFQIHKTVIKEMNRLFKGFLWCQGDLAKGRAKVAWSTMCKPKDQDGLGLKDMNLWNEALLSKHVWNIAAKKDSMWVKWIHEERDMYEANCNQHDTIADLIDDQSRKYANKENINFDRLKQIPVLRFRTMPMMWLSGKLMRES
ncbi:RNA-directed DNA polymerase, eukaryota, reverse transcriptase zinc-binding domain protein [Tanacetum coccineum]